MQYLIVQLLLFGFLSFGFTDHNRDNKVHTTAINMTASHGNNTANADIMAPFVVLELYTSQGCSSCPAADKVLSKTIATAEAKGQKVLALSFHVDYWNYLGWEDPFSKSEYSKRQRWYGKQFGTIYTPQVVVNGTQSFVGSDQLKTKTAVSNELSDNAVAGILLKNLVSNNGRILTRYELSGSYEGCEMHVALIERDHDTAVNRGENKGRKLHNDNVVRLFQSYEQPVAAQGTLVFDLPKGLKEENAQLIVLLQRKKDMKILGANSISIKG